MRNKLLLLFVIFFSISSFASSCLLSDALKDKTLNSDPKFWEEYSKLVSTGKSSDEAIKTIRAKFQTDRKTPTVAASVASAQVGSPRRFSFNKRAEQEMSKLPKNLQKKVDEFLDTALNPRGFAEIRDNPGRWHWEKLKQFGPHAQSVRLNGGYRILFDLKDDGQLVIREINKGHIHGS